MLIEHVLETCIKEKSKIAVFLSFRFVHTRGKKDHLPGSWCWLGDFIQGPRVMDHDTRVIDWKFAKKNYSFSFFNSYCLDHSKGVRFVSNISSSKVLMLTQFTSFVSIIQLRETKIKRHDDFFDVSLLDTRVIDWK